jgi:hypothetical protein
MTHEYTLLVGGTVIAPGGTQDASALAWAAGTILALGSDDEVRAISRGDSHVVELRGAFVIPLEADGVVRWPTRAAFAVGGSADLALLRADPRVSTAGATADLSEVSIARVRAGHLVAGAWP